MKVTLIQPAMGRRNGKKFKRPWTMEPLNLVTLAGLTPDDIEVEFFDDRIEDVDYDTRTDLVGISVETYTALRSYEIAGEFRKRQIPVVLGGVHPTLLPNESKSHADTVFIGQAEGVWPKLLEDFRKGNLQETYKGDVRNIEGIEIDRSILEGKKYASAKLIEFGRGCPYSCDFCDIPLHFDGKYLARNLDVFMEELGEAGGNKFLFVDDNINANPRKLEGLCDRLAGENIGWYSQATSRIGGDESRLDKLSNSGCKGLLIGFESLNKKNLMARNKNHNNAENYGATIKRLKDRGIQVYASFIVGNEGDTRESVTEMVDFAIDSGVFIANFNPLVPIPATPFYNKLKADGRLQKDEWWLDPGHKYGDFVFDPGSMSGEEAEEVCLEAKQRFYSLKGIVKRAPFRDLKNLPAYIGVNGLTRMEVLQKNDVYLGLEGGK